MMKRPILLGFAMFASAAFSAAGLAQDVVSGLAVGAPTQSVPVLDVTGPYAGQRICYVCEFQDDPNVLAFFKDASDETEQLILELDALYRKYRDQNFKAVAMIQAGPDASGWLEELNESWELEIPLVVFRRGPADVAARLFELNPDVQNTFLLTENRFVVANVSGIGPNDFEAVTDATVAMLAREGQ